MIKQINSKQEKLKSNLVFKVRKHFKKVQIIICKTKKYLTATELLTFDLSKQIYLEIYKL